MVESYRILYLFFGLPASQMAYVNHIIVYTSRAGQAGGGSFKKKLFKSKKEFAYRMCTG